MLASHTRDPVGNNPGAKTLIDLVDLELSRINERLAAANEEVDSDLDQLVNEHLALTENSSFDPSEFKKRHFTVLLEKKTKSLESARERLSRVKMKLALDLH